MRAIHFPAEPAINRFVILVIGGNESEIVKGTTEMVVAFPVLFTESQRAFQIIPRETAYSKCDDCFRQHSQHWNLIPDGIPSVFSRLPAYIRHR